MIRGITVVLAVVLLPMAAMAQEQEAKTPDGLIAQGHKAYLAADFEGALAKYEAARDMDSGSAAAYYFIGCTQAKLARTDEAVTTFNTAATIAGSKDPAIHSKALFAAAVSLEAAKRWEDAAAAWKKYQSYAETHKDTASFDTVAVERIEAIEKYTKLNADYAIVRERSKPAEKGAN